MLQTGRSVAVLNTYTTTPMVISVVSNTVGNWATEERFYSRLVEHKTTQGELTATAWQYIGRQGVLGGTYELLRAAPEKHSREPAAPHCWVLTVGPGGTGPPRPILVRMLELFTLVMEADPAELAKLRAVGGIGLAIDDLDGILAIISAAITERRPVVVGLLGNAVDVFPAVVTSSARPDVVTDQIAVRDVHYGYLPSGYTLESWAEARETDPEKVERDARVPMAAQVRAMLALRQRGSAAFKNGNNLRAQASHIPGEAERQWVFMEIPGFMEGYLRLLFSRGIGPFWQMILSGDDNGLMVVDDLTATIFPERPEITRWIDLARHHTPAQGLPVRSCWFGYGERSALALAVNETVADGRISASVVFSRNHLDAAGMTHPRIGTEGMRDDSDGVTDWPILDATLLAVGGADLVAVYSGGGSHSRWMQSAGVIIVTDGTEAAATRLRQALDLDSGLGAIHHVTAGYEDAPDAVKRSHEPGTHGMPLNLIRNRPGPARKGTDMREPTMDDVRWVVLGGGVSAYGSGGWQDHGELMGRMATTLNRSVLAGVDELLEDSWVATITAIGAPAAPGWEIRPIDYVDALRKLTELPPHSIAAVITGQNGYSITLNGWIRSSALGVKTLNATGDVRAYPIGRLGSLGLTTREGYETIQVVSGGNQARHGHLLSINIGRVGARDDVLYDISVRFGGFTVSARNPVELGWVREHAVLGVISLVSDLGRAMEEVGAGRSRAGKRVTGTVVDFLDGEIVDEGPFTHEVDLVTRGGWDHDTFRIGEHTVPYLNKYMTIDGPSGRVAIYPDTIFILQKDNGLPLAVKDAVEGHDVALVKVDVARPPLSLSTVDHVVVGECEDIMGIGLSKYPPERRETPDGGTRVQA